MVLLFVLLLLQFLVLCSITQNLLVAMMKTLLLLSLVWLLMRA